MNLPNKLTTARILLVPFVIAAFLLTNLITADGYKFMQLVATAIFIIAASTDFLDGYIARKHNLVTNLGKFLDAIADKILMSVAMILVVFNAPMWAEWVVVCVAVTLMREFFISALRMQAASKNIIMAADKFGKIKTVLQSIALPILMAAPELSVLCGIEVQWIFIPGFVMLALSTVMAVFSGANYMVKNGDALKD